MARISTAGGGKLPAAKDDLISRIKAGMVLPIISREVMGDLVMGSRQGVVEKFAAASAYPLPDRDDLPKMAKFYAIDQEKDDWALKSFYLDVVKSRMYDVAEARKLKEETLAEADDQFDRLNATELAHKLEFLNFAGGQQDPLMILANFRLPIYVTTCCHSFMEAALVRAGRKPENIRSEFFRWHRGLDDGQVAFQADFKPTPEEPLVYHLFGIDTRPDSIVLTEDDHLRFLIALSSERARNTDPLPPQITTALNTSAVLMLGFRLRDWAFRTVFWGLIRESQRSQHGEINLQLRQSKEEEAYLEAYLKHEANLRPRWLTIEAYTQELYAKWREQDG